MGDTTRFKSWLKLIGAAGALAGFSEVLKQGEAITESIRRNAPRKSGRLQQSVRMELGRFEVKIKAGGPLTTVPVRSGQTPSYDYALGQEFGTEHVPARPFFYSTWRIGRPVARRQINRAIKRAIEANND